MFTFLLILQTIIAAALVAVILMQRSEGGGLGVGGSSAGLMTARGAADFLTRATAILATLFIILSITLAGLAAVDRAPSEIDATLQRQTPAQTAPGTAPLTGAPGAAGTSGDPLAGVAAQAGNGAAPAAPANQSVPLAQ